MIRISPDNDAAVYLLSEDEEYRDIPLYFIVTRNRVAFEPFYCIAEWAIYLTPREGRPGLYNALPGWNFVIGKEHLPDISKSDLLYVRMSAVIPRRGRRLSLVEAYKRKYL